MHPGTWIILNTLGGVALFVWGVRMVRTGVMRAWGDRLKRFIEANLGSAIRSNVPTVRDVIINRDIPTTGIWQMPPIPEVQPTFGQRKQRSF